MPHVVFYSHRMTVNVSKKGALKMKPKYKIVDIYEGLQTVGYAQTISEARQIAKQWDEDTDGENYLMYYPLNPVTGKYTREKALPLYF